MSLPPAALLAVAGAVLLLALYFAFWVQDWRDKRNQERRRQR